MKVAIVDYGMGNLHSVLKSVQGGAGLVQAKCRGLSDFAARRSDSGG